MAIDIIKSGILPEQILRNRTQGSDRLARREGFAGVLEGEIRNIPETEAFKTFSVTWPAESGWITQPVFHVIEQLSRMTVSGPSREDEQWIEAFVYIFCRTPEFTNEWEKTGFGLKTSEIKRWTSTI